MKPLKTILAKELRSYFLSPVALIFLGIFLVVNLFVFFTYATFFARNIADVRPMFEWLPILLIFLVAAISMRSWSEEQAGGTLEILMTMPIQTWNLVFGKLAAGMVLVSVALLLTLPLPIMVSFLGDMDGGPVVGGYVGALFLAMAYMSIGMCVSAKTNNQIVSLMVTGVIGALFYLIGSETVVSFVGADTGELLRALGSGSRFYNIERGVLDLRDIFYYVSIAAFFVTLNIHFIDMKRLDTQQAQGKSRAFAKTAMVSLVAANMILGNLWLAPVTSIRADLTEDGQFSISDATEKILDNLNEPLVIAGYFSEKTHPLLAPLVPNIRDFLQEYKNAGGGKVVVKFENPNADEELEQEVAQAYNIQPLPFRIAARHQQSVVNAYFHILVKYGDEYEVLSVDQLVEVQANGDDVDVKLKNLEYDVTKAIKKVSSGFQSIESVFASMDKPSKLTLFVTPKNLPEDAKELPQFIQKVADELKGKSNGKFNYEEVDVEGNTAKQQELLDNYGFQPMALDLFGEQTFYLHLLLEAGGKKQRIALQGAQTEASIRSSIEGAFKRAATGFIKTIGLFTETPEPPPRDPRMPPNMQPPPPKPDFQVFEQQLTDEFKVQRVDMADGAVPGDIDILVIAKPGAMTDKQKFAIDQYLMSGGAVIAMAGDQRIQATQGSVTAVAADPGLKEMLKNYGVNIESGFVLDAQNASFPVPVQEQKGMFMVRKIQMMDYPFFPDIRKDQFAKGHVATSGLQNVVLNWGSAIDVEKEQKGVTSTVILKTTDQAWTRNSPTILPESIESAATEFAPPDDRNQYALAAVLEGSFKSYFSDKPSPLFTEAAAKAATAESDGDTDPAAADAAQTDDSKKTEDRTGRTLKEALPGAKLAVVGSSEFLSDIAVQIGQQMGGNVYRSNYQFARNLIDWAVADTDLLEIRTSGTFARTLKPIEEETRSIWEWANYIFVLVALSVVVFVTVTRRRKQKSLLDKEGR
ncbi:MAG: Gldg family protein [Deltaproteobacteria bacterium]|nr:Gldg family protein [Deltaproteobacteria bacterium]MBN2674228.1 Gldg family protein [Deltaproteobacteria bacterium]